MSFWAVCGVEVGMRPHALRGAGRTNVSAFWSWDSETRPPQMHIQMFVVWTKWVSLGALVMLLVGSISWALAIRALTVCHSGLAWCTRPMSPCLGSLEAQWFRGTSAPSRGARPQAENQDQCQWLLQLNRASSAQNARWQLVKKANPFWHELGLVLSKLLISYLNTGSQNFQDTREFVKNANFQTPLQTY